ncbi:methyltransferase domain-containing protein [Runella sp. MFBS21]|uniref:class I SAM-dependent methyltransferase n=1 Tax=Runella sp. MFBS21 TaxID=3034018 RepID=UPI0023F87F81|nr:methyltransferase domain-containing protein [Runella sp. MFBS21]MDF7818267.1 methyltransferase domain-containing protein [Runella sp. MFBS21]
MPSPFIPALKYHFLTPIYDWFIALTLPEIAVKKQLIRQANIKKAEKVLDYGCGTGTLLLLLEELHPDCEAIGIEVDTQMLKMAQRKVAEKNSSVQLQYYEGDRLPYETGTFDKVISSWVFQHLTTSQKITSFREIHRVLKPEGEFHMADWGKAQNALMRSLFFVVQMIDNFYTTDDNIQGRLPSLMQEAGFSKVEILENQSTLFGTLSYFKALKS